MPPVLDVLEHMPFTASPDPTVVYVTEAWKSTVYKTRLAIEHRQGLAAILGDPGLGKSTLLRYLYAHYSAFDKYLCTFIPTPNFKSDYACLKTISGGLGMEPRRSMQAQQDAFEALLTEKYAEGLNVVVFLDEAQKLDNEQLELVRTLLNFETDSAKLIQVVMAGNLDLRDRLMQKKQKALSSRIFALSVIDVMSPGEMAGMLKVRCERDLISWPFEDESLPVLYAYAKGVPRVALRAAAYAYAEMKSMKAKRITAEMMGRVTGQLQEFTEEGLSIHGQQAVNGI